MDSLQAFPMLALRQLYHGKERGSRRRPRHRRRHEEDGLPDPVLVWRLRSWQDIEKFTRREGFDEFHCADEFSGLGESSSWGIADGPFFEEVLKAMQKDEEDTFYFNPYNEQPSAFAFDVDSKGVFPGPCS